MKKRLTGLLLCVVTVLSLVGCGKDKNTPTISPDTEIQTAPSGGIDGSEYIGMTVNEFAAAGAELTGYSGFDGTYEFTAVNREKAEKYTFYLEDGVAAKMEEMEFGDDYQKFIGDLKIKDINVVAVDTEKANACIGKTIGELRQEGYVFNGHMAGSIGVNLYTTIDGFTVSLRLDSSAVSIYNDNKDTFEINGYELLNNCKVDDIWIEL